jgi:hypothetical protein
MSDSIQDRLKTDWQKAKATSSSRLERVRNIIQVAATEAVTEVKVGSGELGAIAQDSLTNVVSNWQLGLSQSSSSGEPDATAPTTLKSRLLAVLTKLKEQIWQRIQPRVVDLNENLTNRYGDRYETLKHQVETVKTKYVDARAKGEMPIAEAVQHQQTKLETRAAAAGEAAARQEQQIRQRVKDFVQATATKISE